MVVQSARGRSRARPGSCARCACRPPARRGGRARRRGARGSGSAEGEKRPSTPCGTTAIRSGSRSRPSCSSRRENSERCDHQPRAARQQRQDAAAGRRRTTRRVPARVAQRGQVVDDDHVAPRHGRREVGRAVEHARLARRRRQQRLLPEVAGAVREGHRRAHHRVAVGPQARQPRGHLHRHALDAADLAPRGGARVDDHRGVPPGNGPVAVSAGRVALLGKRPRSPERVAAAQQDEAHQHDPTHVLAGAGQRARG